MVFGKVKIELSKDGENHALWKFHTKTLLGRGSEHCFLFTERKRKTQEGMIGLCFKNFHTFSQVSSELINIFTNLVWKNFHLLKLVTRKLHAMYKEMNKSIYAVFYVYLFDSTNNI